MFRQTRSRNKKSVFQSIVYILPYLLQRNAILFLFVSDYFSVRRWKHYSIFLSLLSRIHITIWNDFLVSFPLSHLTNMFSIIFHFIFYCKMSSQILHVYLYLDICRQKCNEEFFPLEFVMLANRNIAERLLTFDIALTR